MLPQRLRWLLPALIVPWLHLQFGAALPAHDERMQHVSANTFGPRSVSHERYVLSSGRSVLYQPIICAYVSVWHVKQPHINVYIRNRARIGTIS